MICSIVKRNDASLRQVARIVTTLKDVEHVIDDLWDTLAALKSMHSFGRGIGIAAPQIGYNWRINVVEFGCERLTLVNPKLIHRSKKTRLAREGCLSFFDYRGYVPRHEIVRICATDGEGKFVSFRAEGDFSMLLQHELDHLDGRLYDDHLPAHKTLLPHPGMPQIP